MREDILILVKTYPTPSSKYVETTCLAGITKTGEMRRLFPAPFRLLNEEKKFSKWQIISIETDLPNRDNRPESRRGDFDTMKPLNTIPSGNGWKIRMDILRRIPRAQEFSVITHHDAHYSTPLLSEGQTLALYVPESNPKLKIVKGADDWTQKEKEMLKQDGLSLFSREEMGLPEAPLEKIPHDFYYCFNAPFANDAAKEVQFKISDWEIGVLYRKMRAAHGENWKSYVTKKYEPDPKEFGVALMLGTIHKFPYQWLIIGVYLIPRRYMLHLDQKGLFEEADLWSEDR